MKPRPRTQAPPKLLVIGHAGFDVNHFPGREITSRLGAAGFNAAKGAAAFGRVGLVTRVGTDFPLDELPANVDGRGVKVVDGKTTRLINHYNEENDIARFQGEFNVARGMNADDIPREFLDATHAHVSTMPPGLQLKFIAFLREHNPEMTVSVDTSEAFLTRFPRLTRRVIDAADIVSLNEREHELLERAGALAGKIVVRKKGAQGAELHSHGTVTSHPAPHVTEIRNPTGAGDVLAGAFMALLTRHETPANALKQSVAHASAFIGQS